MILCRSLCIYKKVVCELLSINTWYPSCHLRDNFNVHLQLKSYFVHYLKMICDTVLESVVSILKQIVWKTQKWHWNFQWIKWFLILKIKTCTNIIMINNSRTITLTKMLLYFWVSHTICFRMLIFFSKYSVYKIVGTA